jgi:hypothetical protein
MTNEFNVIGERKDDDLHLLVRGDDGQHYDYAVASEQVMPVEPDDRWKMDVDSPADATAREAGDGPDPQPETIDETSVG